MYLKQKLILLLLCTPLSDVLLSLQALIIQFYADSGVKCTPLSFFVNTKSASFSFYLHIKQF